MPFRGTPFDRSGDLLRPTWHSVLQESCRGLFFARKGGPRKQTITRPNNGEQGVRPNWTADPVQHGSLVELDTKTLVLVTAGHQQSILFLVCYVELGSGSRHDDYTLCRSKFAAEEIEEDSISPNVTRTGQSWGRRTPQS